MLKDQTFEGHRENLNQAFAHLRVLLDTLNRHRGNGQEKITMERVHVHSGGQSIVGTIESPAVDSSKPAGQSWPCTSARNAEPEREPELVPSASDVERPLPDARAECRQEHQRAIRMPSNTGAMAL